MTQRNNTICHLQERLQTFGCNQVQLSMITGLPQCNISLYMKGKRIPSVTVAIRIAEALNCTVQDIWEVIA